MKKGLQYLFVMIAFCTGTGVNAQSIINLRQIGSISLNSYNVGAAEISAYDEQGKKLFVVNGATGDIDLVDISNPSNPVLTGTIDLALWGRTANSLDIEKDIVAVAVEDYNKQANGKVVFFNTNGQFLKFVTVGALPDMLTFSPDGKTIVVACEGEPNDAYTVDPPGIISIIEIPNINAVKQSKVKNLDFSQFNTSLPAGVRKFGPGASVAQDMEPEYVAISSDNKTAWVSLQENNAIAIVDIQHKKIDAIMPLGFKDHSASQNGLDASDQNSGVIDIKPWPVFGIYEPDAIDAVKINHDHYIVTANEGDAREYAGLNEIKRVSSLTLDPVAFPNAVTLKNNNNLGRLNVTNTLGDTDNDGDFDQLYSFGARSFSILDENGNLIWDSGNQLEQITSTLLPDYFNCSNTNNTKKNRSDDKGPEPEGLVVAEILDSFYVFIGLERIGGIIVYNITDPLNPYFVQYLNTRNFNQTPGLNSGGDLGPEGMLFIEAKESPNGKNLLITSNEVSGTISIFETDYLCGKKKVEVCYNGSPLCVHDHQLNAYLQNGAKLGDCSIPRLASSVGLIKKQISVFPNPANDKININIFEEISGNYTLNIHDLSGRTIFTESLNIHNGAAVEIQTTNIPEGVYFLSIPELVLPMKLIIHH